MKVFDTSTSAMLMIDMQRGFIDSESPLCIAGAEASIAACGSALNFARNHGVVVIHVRRHYAVDGSDVEPVRRKIWEEGGRPLSDAWPDSLVPPRELEALHDERVLLKPSFSAFFQTELHEALQNEGISTLILIGTTTPNCIRSTCYDALSYGYDVIVVSDATSSRSDSVQRANLDDMAYIGATVCSVAELADMM